MGSMPRTRLLASGILSERPPDSGGTLAPRPHSPRYKPRMHLLLTLVAVGVGALIAIQPALNTQLARSLGHPFYGAFTNFAAGLALIAAIGLAIIRPAAPKWSDLGSAPCWAWFGGLLGATFVTLAILLLPKLGAVLFFGAVLVGQLLAATAIDQFGLLGVAQKAITPTRLLGLLCLVAGVILVQLGTGVSPAGGIAPLESDATGAGDTADARDAGATPESTRSPAPPPTRETPEPPR